MDIIDAINRFFESVGNVISGESANSADITVLIDEKNAEIARLSNDLDEAKHIHPWDSQYPDGNNWEDYVWARGGRS